MTAQTDRQNEEYRKPPALILWDWNGTLLDDVIYAIGVRNRVFPRFGLPVLESLDQYYEQFTFPVKTYYTRAGVTEESFVEVAHAWMAEYLRGYAGVPLFADALPALDAFARAGCRQAVLSASKLDTLRMQLRTAGILDRFTDVLGLSHIYATDKTEIGRAYLAETALDPRRCVMLGDTLHDADVAEALGCRCVLVARGHQSRKTLLRAGVPICDTLSEATGLLLGRKNDEA
ncbi:MAG: HAD hydrolase-like protein [Eubacteriales bacterium]|nr:HAD hydrolase-like protein [Eubacteriales bacterium]